MKPSGGEERSGAEGATRLVCKPIKGRIAHNEFHVWDFSAHLHACDGVSEVQGM